MEPEPVESHPASISVVCISDTHNNTLPLPAGDLLVHAGDLSANGTFTELQKQLDWLNDQPHEHKVVIAGNHDRLLDEKLKPNRSADPGKLKSDLKWGSIVYLEDSTAELLFANGRTLKIYGSPWTPKFGASAFQYSSTKASSLWNNKIPSDVDVVVTHGPPRGHLDVGLLGRSAGCRSLLKELQRVKPLLVVFGHIHESAGQESLVHDRRTFQRTILVNAAILCSGLPFTRAIKAAITGTQSAPQLRSPVIVTI